MRGNLYLTIIALITVVILVGLFFYNKGQTKNISGTLPLNEDITLEIEKVRVRPAESGMYYIILYGGPVNHSSREARVILNQPEDPCEKLFLYSRNYNSYPSPGLVETEYNRCLSSNEYQKYMEKKEEYKKEVAKAKIELRTPQNVVCTPDPYYQLNQKDKNIDSTQLGSQVFQPGERKTGMLVFKCPEKKGKFTIKYRDSSLELDI